MLKIDTVNLGWTLLGEQNVGNHISKICKFWHDLAEIRNFRWINGMRHLCHNIYNHEFSIICV